jgi:hypothetical protein
MTAPDQRSRVFCSVRGGDSDPPPSVARPLTTSRCSRAFPPKPGANAPSKSVISQFDLASSPPDGGTLEFPPHEFQIFHFPGAALASPKHDVDARPANKAVSLRARRTLCGLQLSNPGYICGFATKRIRSRIFKTTLLFVNLACALPLTERLTFAR